MAKIIKHAYPVEYSIGLLLLIFGLSFFLSSQIFATPLYSKHEGENVYLGMFLVSSAVIIMVLILWEELLFPVRINLAQEGIVFRNHRTKLKKQLLIYCIIPIIFGFIYYQYDVNHVRFFIWAAVCIGVPVAGKLVSGIKNYNDFLKFSHDTIEYKNNEKTGTFAVQQVHHIELIKDETTTLHKIQLVMTDNTKVTIDLDEMELEAYLDSIDKFVSTHYKNLLKQ